MLVENSGADIAITAEINLSSTSLGNSCNVILSGYDASTGMSLANKVFTGGRFRSDDWAKVTNVALNKTAMAQFLQVIQTKFDDMVANGHGIIVDISFSESSQMLTSTELGTDYLSFADQIENWMAENAYKNYYHIQGVTDRQMILDDVRIPLRDPKTGRNYSASRFAQGFYAFLRRLLGDRVQSVKRQVKGNKLYITIN